MSNLENHKWQYEPLSEIVIGSAPLGGFPPVSPALLSSLSYDLSAIFSLLVTFLLVTFSWLFHLLRIEKQCSWLFCGFPCFFSRLCHGPRFGQILHVLALEKKKSSESSRPDNPCSYLSRTAACCFFQL